MKPLTPATPHVIIMVGIPGAGKSTFAEHFAKTFHTPFINTKEIATKADISAKASVQVSMVLLDQLLKTQRTIIYDGPTNTKTARLQIVRHARTAGYRPLLVWVQTESMEARRRATKRISGQMTLSSDDFDAAIARFQPPAPTEKAIVISGKHTYATQMKVVLKYLASSAPRGGQDTDDNRPRPARNIVVR